MEESKQSSIVFPQFGAGGTSTVTCDITNRTSSTSTRKHSISNNNKNHSSRGSYAQRRIYASILNINTNQDNLHSSSSNNGSSLNSSKEQNQQEGHSGNEEGNTASSDNKKQKFECIEILDDSDSDRNNNEHNDAENDKSKRVYKNDENDEQHQNNTSKNAKSEPFTQRIVIEIDDDDDGDNDDDSDDEIVFVGVHNQTKINLEQRLKAASKERERKLHCLHAKSNTPFIYNKRTTTIGNNGGMDSKTGGGAKSKRLSSSMFYDINNIQNNQQYQPQAPTALPKRRKQYKRRSHRNLYDDSSISAMKEQERLLSEAANRVRSNYLNQNHETQQQPQHHHQDQNHFLSCHHIVTDIIYDVTLLPSDHWKRNDPYSRLGVPQNTSYDIVKRNYRKLLLLYHPDKNKCHDDAVITNRFLAIKEAFEIITERTQSRM